MSITRTRYAPSPTGKFHIGGARTALYNYLFAKKNKGSFIVRIEDTDLERNMNGAIEQQLDNLEWLKIHVDESLRNENPEYAPYIQSKKLDRYKQLAKELLDKELAYFCFCSKEELDASREEAAKKGVTPKYNRKCLNLSTKEIKENIDNNIPHVIRLKINDNTTIEWEDMIRGKISVPTSALTDPVILKSNEIAMYNFGVVIDDYDMDITHVLRGEEHISNTPYQIAIKEALGFNKKNITYGHLSVIVNETGKKLSKRDESTKQFIEDYNQMGFCPEAISNFLVLLGWAPSDNKEIMSMDEMITKFEISHVSKSPTFFDFKKLLWINNQYFKKMTEDQFVNFVKPFISIDLKNFKKREKDIICLFKNQLNFAQEINGLIKETFIEHNNIYKKATNKEWDTVISVFLDEINKTNQISFEDAKQIISNVKTKTNKNGKELFAPIRIAITGSEHGPELNKIISILGKEEILKRLK